MSYMKWTIVTIVSILLYFGEDSFARDKNFINIGFDNYIHSNTIYNSFFNDFFADRTISEESKMLVVDNLKNNNRFGNYTDYYINFSRTLNQSLKFHAGYNNIDYIGANISNGFFKLLFEGNTKYKGESLNLSETGILGYKFDRLYLGLASKTSDHISIGFHAGLIKGNELTHMLIPDASLFTSTEGDSIALDGNLSVSVVPFTDRWAAQGWGVSLALFSSYQNDLQTITVLIDNLGFIKWHKATRYQSEGEKSFTGIESDDLFASDLFQFDQNDPEDLLGIEETTEDWLMGLPLLFRIKYQYHGFEKWQISMQANYIRIPGYTPQLITSGIYQFPYGINGGLSIIAGGYTRFDYGLIMEKNIKDKMLIGVKTFYIENWIAPNQTTGQGMSIYASHLF